MAVERTFSMLKPGVLQRRIAGEVLSRIEGKGLKIVGAKLVRISRGLAETHYAEHRGKPFFEELVAYVTSGPVLALAIEGDEAIGALRRLCGATKASEALPGTIRGDFALHTNFNIIHASDSPQSAERELGLFFAPGEILEWEDSNGTWI